MLANNETGVIQPVAEAAAMVHAAGGLLHVDAVQGPGRIACDFKALGADLMTLSAHKIGGPQGVGALIRRDGLALDPLITGGGQERGARAGTENVAGIAGFGAAAEAARQALAEESRPDGGVCATGWRPASRRSRRKPSFSAPRPRGCPTPRCSRCPA